MSTQHTPGPWIVGYDEDSDFYLVGLEESPGLVTHPIVRLHDEPNARLIAAAPELLQCLQQAIRELEGYEAEATGESYNNPVFNAAIAKATAA